MMIQSQTCQTERISNKFMNSHRDQGRSKTFEHCLKILPSLGSYFTILLQPLYKKKWVGGREKEREQKRLFPLSSREIRKLLCNLLRMKRA